MADKTQQQAIGFMGLPAAGKSYSANLAGDALQSPVVNIGDVVRSIARSENELGSDADGEAIGDWVTEQLESNGKTAIISKVIQEIDQMELAELTIIDGIRTPTDVEELSAYFSEFLLIYIDADIETRYQRLTDRGRDGEEDFTITDLQQRDERELSWGVNELIETDAFDHVLSSDNESTFDDRLMTVLYEFTDK